MSPFRLSVLLAAILGLVFPALSQTLSRDNRQHTASISGRVTISGQSAANAAVTVSEAYTRSRRENTGVDAAEPKEMIFVSVKTDENGRYQLTGLPAGSYQMRALSLAYIPENRSAGLEPFKQITLDEGEKRDNVDFALVPGGVITGRVTDSDGRPLISIRVNLFVVDEMGQKRRYERGYMWQVFSTDDRGIYRLYGIPSGRYVVCFGADGDFDSFGSSAKKYPKTYHLDAIDESRAKVIEIKETDRFILNAGQRETKIANDGSFRVFGILPGKVMFHVGSPKTSGFSILRVERNNVEMKDGIDVSRGETVTGVRIIVQHGSGIIRGQVKIEGGKLPEAARLHITIRNTAKEGYSRGFIEVDEKGHFMVEGLIPGEYEVSLQVRTNLNPVTGEANVSTEPGQQLVRVTNGAETHVTLTLDLSRKNQQKQ